MKKGYKVIAIVAPAFVGQFGDKLTPEKLTAAMKILGFDSVVEVAVGADLCTPGRGQGISRAGGEGQSYMGTSCCPAWISMVDICYPDQSDHISMTLTPMVLTARMVKKQHPGRQGLLYRPLRRQEAGGQPGAHPQRRGLCADLRGAPGHV